VSLVEQPIDLIKDREAYNKSATASHLWTACRHLKPARMKWTTRQPRVWTTGALPLPTGALPLPQQPASPKARITEQITTNIFLIEFSQYEKCQLNIATILEFMASAERPHFPNRFKVVVFN
jgi:hypothetical protein